MRGPQWFVNQTNTGTVSTTKYERTTVICHPIQHWNWSNYMLRKDHSDSPSKPTLELFSTAKYERTTLIRQPDQYWNCFNCQVRKDHSDSSTRPTLELFQLLNVTMRKDHSDSSIRPTLELFELPNEKGPQRLVNHTHIGIVSTTQWERTTETFLRGP